MSHISIPWGQLDISEIKAIDLPFDQKVCLQKIEDEVIITKTQDSGDTTYRFIAGKNNHVFLQPSLPDLPITIKPKQVTSILPGCRMEAYIEVPLLLSVYYGTNSKKELLLEFPLEPLSRSFFGSPDNGEISYFLESLLLCDYEAYGKKDSSIYCPLIISNKSMQKLDVERMILRVPLLSIFSSKDYLLSSPVSIAFRGQDMVSQISYLKYSSEKKQQMVSAAPPRQKEDKSLIKKSFYFLKTLYTG